MVTYHKIVSHNSLLMSFSKGSLTEVEVVFHAVAHDDETSDGVEQGYSGKKKNTIS